MGVKIRQKVKGGPWWVFVAHKGKRTSRLVGPDKDSATALAKQLRVALVAGDFQIPKPEPVEKPLTFGEYAEAFLKEAEQFLKRSTWKDYASCVACHLKPPLGERPLAEITRREVKDFIVGLRQAKKSTAVARKALRIFSSIMTAACEDEKIDANPVLQIRTRQKRKLLRSVDLDDKPPRRIDPLSPEELTHLLTTARTYSTRSKWGRRPGEAERKERKITQPFRAHYPFLLLLARTGLRLGEAVALRFGDVDWHGQFITVERAYVRGRVTTTKTDKIRRVQMSPQLCDTLRELYRKRFGQVTALDAEQQAKLEAKRAAKAVGEYIFRDAEGGPLNPDNFRARIFIPLLEAADLRKIRIHDLRHTYASQMIAAGKELHFIQQQLGHHSPAFTLSVYGHLLPRDRRSEVDCLDDPKLSGETGTKPRDRGRQILNRRSLASVRTR